MVVALCVWFEGLCFERSSEPSGKVNFENKITKADNAYAYLARWQSFTDLKFLSAIMQKGIKVRSAAKSFEIEGQTYPAGTLVITRTGNERLGAQLKKS
jgi:hypothetical protein